MSVMFSFLIQLNAGMVIGGRSALRRGASLEGLERCGSVKCLVQVSTRMRRRKNAKSREGFGCVLARFPLELFVDAGEIVIHFNPSERSPRLPGAAGLARGGQILSHHLLGKPNCKSRS